MTSRALRADYWRRVYGDGSVSKDTSSRIARAAQAGWHRSKRQGEGGGGTSTGTNYIWHGRKICVVKATPGGGGMAAIRTLQSQPVPDVPTSPLASPKRMLPEEPVAEEPVASFAVASSPGASPPSASPPVSSPLAPLPPTPKPPPTPKASSMHSPIKTSLLQLNQESQGPSAAIIPMDGGVITLKLSPNAKFVTLRPSADGFVVVEEVNEDPEPAEPAAPEPAELAPSYDASFDDGSDLEAASDEIIAACTTYSYSSISYPATSLPSCTQTFTHAVHRSLDTAALMGATTAYETFNLGVTNHPTSPMLGTIVPPTTADGAMAITQLTYEQVAATVATVASNLSPHLAPNSDGDTLLGIFMANSPAWIIAEQAAYYLSAAAVPLYSTLGTAAIVYILEQTEMTVVVCGAKEAKVLRDIKSSNPELKLSTIVVCGTTSDTSDTSDTSESPNPSLTELSLTTLSEGGAQSSDPTPPTPPTPSSLATICYTSGTTGPPKGVMLTHSNFIAVASAVASTVVRLQNADVHFSYLPLAHIFERTMHVAIQAHGAATVFGTGNVKTMTEEVKLVSPTLFIAVPRVLSKFHDGIRAKVAAAGPAKEQGFKMALSAKLANLKTNVLTHEMFDGMAFNKIKEGLGLQNVKFLLTGGAAISGDLKDFFRCVLSVPVIEGYGQTECCAAMSITSLEDHSSTGHVGVPLPCCEIRLENVAEMGYLSTDTMHGDPATGEKVLGRGEVCVRGPGVMVGYYKMTEETSNAVVDGWLHTGDIGAFTSDGQLKIIDRKKDLFKLSQGEYVSPERIENVLQSSKYVAQSFVWGLGVKDYPVAVIVVDPASVSPSLTKKMVLEDLKQVSIEGGLQGFEIVKNVILEAKVPFGVENGMLTPTMKLKRIPLLKKYKEELIALYDEELKKAPEIANMWKNQKGLPRLPLPSLENSIKLLLEVTETLVTADVFSDTQRAAADFLKNDGPVLQEKLKSIDDSTPDSSWFANFHHDMYMNARYPGYIYKNPAGVTRDALFDASQSQVERAAHIICSTLKYAEQVVHETLEPDVFHGIPLDMLQYARMFGNCRVPGKGRDELYEKENVRDLKHVLVMRGSKMWKLDFRGYDKFSLGSIQAALDEVMAMDEGECLSAPGVGVLTCDDRDSWYENREKLKELGNGEVLKTIDDALMVVCLDVDGDDSLEGDMRAARSGNPRHRWFDKPATIIVRKNGRVCSNCEHSWGDGIAMMRWGTEMRKEIGGGGKGYMQAREGGGEEALVEELQWVGVESMQEKIEEAGVKADALAGTAKCSILEFKDWGKNKLKEYGVSPDSVMQQVLQLAYMKKHGKTVSSYCVAQHMAFKAGRNERMRGNTVASKDFVKSVIEGEDAKTQFEKLKKACSRHHELSQQCNMGQGFDRHLYALCELSKRKMSKAEIMKKVMANEEVVKLMRSEVGRGILGRIGADLGLLQKNLAEEFNEEIGGDEELEKSIVAVGEHAMKLVKGKKAPALFSDAAFVELMTDTLCSSMMETDFLEVMMASPAFGDFVEKGEGEEERGEEGGEKRGKYFIAYSTMSDKVTFFINGFEPESMESMKEKIEEALRDIERLLEKGGKKKEKGGIDFKAVMKQAMADVDVVAMMTNPKCAGIAGKIMADPKCLLSPMDSFSEELKDPEVAAMMMKVAPKLKALMQG